MFPTQNHQQKNFKPSDDPPVGKPCQAQASAIWGNRMNMSSGIIVEIIVEYNLSIINYQLPSGKLT